MFGLPITKLNTILLQPFPAMTERRENAGSSQSGDGIEQSRPNP